MPLARQGSPSCVVLYSLRQPGAADLLRSTPTGSLIGKKSEKIIMNPPGKMRQNPPYICLPKLKPPLKMKGNPGHIEDIYAIKYIRHMAYIFYGVDKDVAPPGHKREGKGAKEGTGNPGKTTRVPRRKKKDGEKRRQQRVGQNKKKKRKTGVAKGGRQANRLI
ncbi:MAG: hypothetical protein IPM86_12800 [Saprospiraceae bacterium]|nr:hypothetical protein [Saprospiraceae bacterium]